MNNKHPNENWSAQSLSPFGTSVFSEITQRANAKGAINLAQGFPNFEGPAWIVDAALEALKAGGLGNQYAPSKGLPNLRNAIVKHQQQHYGLDLDADLQVGVFSGATEAIAAVLLGLLNPGDEVVLFEPFYDSYPACLALAGAKPQYSTLRAPDFEINWPELELLFGPKTRVLLLNTPHNPSGKVFSRDELERLGRLCERHDVLVICDEVYEHIYFEREHLTPQSIPTLANRCLSISSFGKTFSFTGWKIGWATGPKPMVAAALSAHQFLTFSTATPLQAAAAIALDQSDSKFYEDLRRDYQARRDYLYAGLIAAGYQTRPSEGSYFLLSSFAKTELSDLEYVTWLIEEKGVAAIPANSFYARDREEGTRLIRFAFCKTQDVLERAVAALGGESA